MPKKKTPARKKRATKKSTVRKKAPAKKATKTREVEGQLIEADRRKIGRPTKYRPEFPDMLVAHFDVPHTRTRQRIFTKKNGDEVLVEEEVANTLPTLAGFCAKIGVSRECIHEWVRTHKAFSDAYMRAKEMGEDMLVSNALAGHYNPVFAKFVAQNYTPLREKKELEVKGEVKHKHLTHEELEERIRELDRELEELDPQVHH